MAENSKIEWCDHTFNPWIGCTKISPGCDNCYAAVSTPARTRAIQWCAGAPRQRTTSTWSDPERWNNQHDAFYAEHGRQQLVFCASLADWLDKEVPIEWLVDLLELIRTTRNLYWMLLTKRIGYWRTRIEAALGYLAERGAPERAPLMGWLHAWLTGEHPPRNVWLGATIVNQTEADRDIPKLLATPARVRFLSMEPLLGPVNLWLPTRIWENSAGSVTCDHCCNGDRCDDPTHHERGRPEWSVRCPHCRGTGNGKPLHWVIVGGESGPKARPMHPDWSRSLRDQCAAAGVPFMFKQHGEWIGVSDLRRLPGGGCPGFGDFDHCQHDTFHEAVRVGKKAAGRLLDGRTHDGFPLP